MRGHSTTSVPARRQCTPDERHVWLTHQRASNPETGEWLLVRYREQPLLGLATLTGAPEIAGMTSFFRRPHEDSGAMKRFTIREALKHFEDQAQAGNSDGLARLHKIRRFVGQAGQPGSAPIVTLVVFVDDAVVVDGNHTAMAAYLRALEGSLAAGLPVFVLETGHPSSVLA